MKIKPTQRKRITRLAFREAMIRIGERRDPTVNLYALFCLGYKTGYNDGRKKEKVSQ